MYTYFLQQFFLRNERTTLKYNRCNILYYLITVTNTHTSLFPARNEVCRDVPGSHGDEVAAGEV